MSLILPISPSPSCSSIPIFSQLVCVSLCCKTGMFYSGGCVILSLMVCFSYNSKIYEAHFHYPSSNRFRSTCSWSLCMIAITTRSSLPRTLWLRQNSPMNLWMCLSQAKMAQWFGNTLEGKIIAQVREISKELFSRILNILPPYGILKMKPLKS